MLIVVLVVGLSRLKGFRFGYASFQKMSGSAGIRSCYLYFSSPYAPRVDRSLFEYVETHVGSQDAHENEQMVGYSHGQDYGYWQSQKMSDVLVTIYNAYYLYHFKYTKTVETRVNEPQLLCKLE